MSFPKYSCKKCVGEIIGRLPEKRETWEREVCKEAEGLHAGKPAES